MKQPAFSVSPDKLKQEDSIINNMLKKVERDIISDLEQGGDGVGNRITNKSSVDIARIVSPVDIHFE